MSNAEPTSAQSSTYPIRSADPSSAAGDAGNTTTRAQSYAFHSNFPSGSVTEPRAYYDGALRATQPYPQTNFVPYHSNYPLNYGAASSTPSFFEPRLKTSPPPAPAPSPSPRAPDAYRDWDKAIYSFLVRLGLTQAAAGFEADILVMNSSWEQDNVPDALAELSKHISSLVGTKAVDINNTGDDNERRPLEVRKLDYVHLANGVTPQSQSTINKQISLFLARNRARNDASNRAEFVHSLAKKRQQGIAMGGDIAASCARVDAKLLNRDVQMKYDIARNEDGPLSRTMVVDNDEKNENLNKTTGEKTRQEETSTRLHVEGESNWTAKRYPGLDERLRNVEDHLAVRYVPSSPRTLLTRLDYLERHLIRLERDYPPWAALHFNQPNRGWPPPPRQTPIIVPPHLRDVQPKGCVEKRGPLAEGKPRKNNSSLHQAVLERLEVKQAMNDLAGEG